jgi:hypothetical protein
LPTAVSTLHAILVFASSEGAEHSSKTLYYVLGGGLAVWAVLVSAVGIKRHADWPASQGALRAILAFSTVLVLGAMASAIITG